MSAPRKFDEETRARAVRLYQDRLREHSESKLAAQARRAAARHQPGDAAAVGGNADLTEARRARPAAVSGEGPHGAAARSPVPSAPWPAGCAPPSGCPPRRRG
jgi:hypothetical protein